MTLDVEAVLIGRISKLKQGDLLRVMVERGWSQKELARRLGINYSSLNQLLNMRALPRLTAKQQRLLLEWTGKLPEDLLPAEAQRYFRTSGNVRVEYTSVPLARLAGSDRVLAFQPAGPERVAERERRVVLERALSMLLPREAEIIRARFGILPFEDELTLEKVAEHFKLTKERIRQIETKALRRLRKVIPQLETPLWARKKSIADRIEAKLGPKYSVLVHLRSETGKP